MRLARETFFVQPFVRERWGLQPALPAQYDTEPEARSRAELIACIYDGVAVTALETFDGGAERIVATWGDVPGVTFAVAA